MLFFFFFFFLNFFCGYQSVPHILVQTFSTETRSQTAKHSTPSARIVPFLDESPALAHVLIDRGVLGRGKWRERRWDGSILAGQTTATASSILLSVNV